MNQMNWFLVLFYLSYCRHVLSFEYFDDLDSNETSDRSTVNCGFNAREKCMEPMKKYLSVKHISYGKNENELSETCRKVQKVISCFDEYLENCKTISTRIRDKVIKLSDGHRNFMTQLCEDNSPLRQKYLGFSHCIEHNSKDTLQCYKNYEKEMIDTINEIPFQSHKFGYIQMDSICCALERHNLCTRLILETRCNTTAADLSEELFRLARSDISSDCRSELLRQCNNSEVYFPNPYLLCISLIFIIFEKLFEI